MTTQFAQDVFLARIKTGLCQDDIAHLTDQSRSTISRIERGRREPDFTTFLDLSLIYGRSFEDFFAEKLQTERASILQRLKTLPPLKRPNAKHANREVNLGRMQARLHADLEIHG
ncbi:MAG: helix-turn-helix transcriptional regulator [Pseudomonadota bacterium]